MKPHANRTARRRTTGLLFCCLLAAVSSPLAQTDPDEKWEQSERESWNLDYARYSREDVKAAQAKWKDIETENENAEEDEWTGSYSLIPDGEVTFESLLWSPQAGFVNVYVYTCMSELRYLNFGAVTVSPTTVQMMPEYPPASGRRTTQVTMYVKVKWGDRHYLIEEYRLGDFCDTISGTGIYEEGIIERGFWLKSSDLEKAASGRPTLPPEYKRLLKKPIDARVIAVGKSYVEEDKDNDCLTRTVTPLTLNVGSKSGVKAGIAFRVVTPKDVDYGFIKVLTVSPNTSSALFVPYGFEVCREDETPPDEEQAKAQAEDKANEPPVAVGWKLTTRPVEQ